MPQLECRKQEQYLATQSKDHLKLLALQQSQESGYLIGVGIGKRLCEVKFRTSIAIMEVAVAGSTAPKSELVVEFSTFYKIGLIGNRRAAGVP